MRHMHDELTGMLEGDANQPLYNLEIVDQAQTAKGSEDNKEEEWSREETEKWIAALKGKGGKGGKGTKGNANGKGKGGYGECWNCGKMGHPSRECIVAGKIHGGVGSANGPQNPMVAAFKGKGKHRGGGSWKGNGKGYGKTSGKGFGKGNGKKSLNMATDADYNAAWYNDQWSESEEYWEGE